LVAVWFELELPQAVMTIAAAAMVTNHLFLMLVTFFRNLLTD
jgi:hypothetical protein